jgi:hypothetical protein
MNNENPVARHRTTTIGLFLIVSRDTKFVFRVNSPLKNGKQDGRRVRRLRQQELVVGRIDAALPHLGPI